MLIQETFLVGLMNTNYANQGFHLYILCNHGDTGTRHAGLLSHLTPQSVDNASNNAGDHGCSNTFQLLKPQPLCLLLFPA
jgi:hypothetical protein